MSDNGLSDHAWSQLSTVVPYSEPSYSEPSYSEPSYSEPSYSEPEDDDDDHLVDHWSDSPSPIPLSHSAHHSNIGDARDFSDTESPCLSDTESPELGEDHRRKRPRLESGAGGGPSGSGAGGGGPSGSGAGESPDPRESPSL
jgi:hypothetical protein